MTTWSAPRSCWMLLAFLSARAHLAGSASLTWFTTLCGLAGAAGWAEAPASGASSRVRRAVKRRRKVCIQGSRAALRATGLVLLQPVPALSHEASGPPGYGIIAAAALMASRMRP